MILTGAARHWPGRSEHKEYPVEIDLTKNLDQTDPVGQQKRRLRQAMRWQQQIRQALPERPPELFKPRPMHPGIGTARYEPAAHIVAVELPEWDGSKAMSAPAPTVIFRPRRIARHIPWQRRLIVAGIRLTRMMRKSAKQQMKQFNKLQRQMIRRVLPRHKAMRGAQAR